MNGPDWTRRAFLESALGLGALALLGGATCLAAAPAAARKLRLGLLLPGSGPLAADGTGGNGGTGGNAVALGARLAAEEAQRTAQLVGGSFELLEATAADPKAAAREATRLVEKEKVFALVGGLDRRTREAVSEVTERSRVLFLTTRLPGEALDPEPVREQQFHLTTSHHDLCRALARYLVTEARLASWFFVGLEGEEGRYLTGTARQALLQHGGTIAGAATVDPGATSFASLLAQLGKVRPQLVFLALGEPVLSRLLAALDSSKGSGATLAALPVAGPFAPLGGDSLTLATKRRAIWPALWHPALVAGGAAQLNQRFQARWKRPMGPFAWMGWAAVQAATDLALHAPAGAADLAQRLTMFQFDGHKGIPLHFDSNHFLRQPVYLVGQKPGEGSPGPLALLGQVAPEKGT